jgi:hypothetical protein
MRTKTVLCALLILATSSSLAANRYVSPNGANTPPYTNWTTAARSIQAAVDAASTYDTVWVTNGTYTTTGTIFIAKDIDLRSVNGPTKTIVDGGYPSKTKQVFRLNHLSLEMNGFTVKNGYDTNANGGGIYADRVKEVANCIVVSNVGLYGGGIRCDEGTVRDCFAGWNRAYWQGGGFDLLGITASSVNCRAFGNVAVWGGGFNIWNKGCVRNCISDGNFATNGGGAVIYNGGTIESCTIVSNVAQFYGGVYANTTSLVANCIVFYNKVLAPGSGQSNAILVYTRASNTCNAPLLTGTANVDAPPQFVDLSARNYRLRKTSPCVDTGRERPWMEEDKHDIYGKFRNLGPNPEMGACEFGEALNDQDYDGLSDLVVYYPPLGNWYVRSMSGAVVALGTNWGFSGCTPVCGVGDGYGGLAVYYAAQGRWYIRRLDGSVFLFSEQWGFAGCVPLMADVDCTGGDDMIVFHAASGTWYMKPMGGDPIAMGVNWGFPGCTTAVADYNGNGTADLAVYDSAAGRWYIRELTGEVLAFGENWGFPGCVPVVGDYNGDGRADLALYHQSTGNWYVRTLAGDVILFGSNWGFSGCTPVAGDYDGDGFADLGLFYPALNTWYVRTVTGTVLASGSSWGFAGTTPVKR